MAKNIGKMLKQVQKMQREMLERARTFREENTFDVDEYDAFKSLYNEKDGGFAMSHWCGSPDCEQKVKDDTKATIRCIPFEDQGEEGTCLICGEKSDRRVVFAKSY